MHWERGSYNSVAKFTAFVLVNDAGKSQLQNGTWVCDLEERVISSYMQKWPVPTGGWCIPAIGATRRPDQSYQIICWKVYTANAVGMFGGRSQPMRLRFFTLY